MRLTHCGLGPLVVALLVADETEIDVCPDKVRSSANGGGELVCGLVPKAEIYERDPPVIESIGMRLIEP